MLIIKPNQSQYIVRFGCIEKTRRAEYNTGMMAPASMPESPSGEALIALRRVVKAFKNAAGEVTVLKGIDADFWEGQFVSIVGRSGSGKSTLLNMMTGIDHPTSGLVRIGGVALHTMNEGRMSVWRGRQMGIVFQFFQLLPMLTLLENVMLPMDLAGVVPAAEREARAAALLHMVGLDGLEHMYPAGVAGGQQQTAAVARALANDPPILVADEPTGNLDSKTAERVLAIFEDQVQRGKTVLMVTHDSGLAQRARRRLVIADGELIPEPVSDAFPDLSHAALLQLSHAAGQRALPEGAVLGGGGAVEDLPALVIVLEGTLDVFGPDGRVARQVGPGHAVYGENGAGLRAPHGGQVLAFAHLPAGVVLPTRVEAA
jgi:putative ABC transport system ATP-binding protein